MPAQLDCFSLKYRVHTIIYVYMVYISVYLVHYHTYRRINAYDLDVRTVIADTLRLTERSWGKELASDQGPARMG